MNSIKFFLSVCEDMPEVAIDGHEYHAGHRGEVKIKHTIAEDTLFMDLSTCGHKPRVGNASHIVSVSIRICPKAVTIIAIHDDPQLNNMGCCYCCPNGCCVYGNSGCGCG